MEYVPKLSNHKNTKMFYIIFLFLIVSLFIGQLENNYVNCYSWIKGLFIFSFSSVIICIISISYFVFSCGKYYVISRKWRS